MAYILYLEQEGREHLVGIFTEQDSMMEFIHKIPFVQLRESTFDGRLFQDYLLNYEHLPDEYIVNHRGANFLLTRFMFAPGSEISIFWREAHEWDRNDSSAPEISGEYPPLIEGATIVDAYSINNEDAIQYIRDREALIAEVTQFYTERGYHITREHQGSEDGEALYKHRIAKMGENHGAEARASRYLFSVDPYALRVWQESPTLEHFLRNVADETFEEEIESEVEPR